MMEAELGDLLKRYQVLREGHFLLTSGMHSDRYFEKFRILEQPKLCERFAQALATHFQSQGITVVCGPTTGGVIVAYEVARQLECRCIIAEKGERGRKIGRGFVVEETDRVLVVDDVMTTGGSIRETLAALEEIQAKIVGIGVFIDRSVGVDFSVPFYSVYKEPVRNYESDKCPLCKKGVPLEVPGRSGKKVGG
ncbi:MAG: orotate phosphoribosyltransferase [candidate division WOR-3 bacterium]